MAALRTTLQTQTRRTAERLVAPLARTGVTPNALTTLGFILNVAAGIILATGSAAFFAGGFAVLIASAFDMFDGALARVKNQKTAFGAFFDSTLDRFSEAALFIGLQIAFIRELPGADDDWLSPAHWQATAGAVLCILVLVGSVMISYARARAEGLKDAQGRDLGVDCEVGWLQRPERVIALGIGLLLPRPLLLAVLAALAIFTHVTVLQRLAHVRRLTSERVS